MSISIKKILTSVEFLKEAKQLLLNPEHWTQGADARDADFNPIEPDNPKAVCFCMSGALKKAAENNDIRFQEFESAINALCTIIHEPIPTYNDFAFRCHEEVLTLFDKAIEILEARNASQQKHL